MFAIVIIVRLQCSNARHVFMSFSQVVHSSLHNFLDKCGRLLGCVWLLLCSCTKLFKIIMFLLFGYVNCTNFSMKKQSHLIKYSTSGSESYEIYLFLFLRVQVEFCVQIFLDDL
jgi:hypothetical protein